MASAPLAPCPNTCCINYTKNPVRYNDGLVGLVEEDITVPSGGWFGHTRSYGNRKAVGAVQGPNGYNWLVKQLPSSAVVTSTTMQITIDQDKTYWFDLISGVWTPRFKFLNNGLILNTTAHTLTFSENANGRTETTVFSSTTGQFISHTDWRGVQTTITSMTGSLITGLQRSFTNLDTSVTTEQLIFAYGSGVQAGLLQSVTYQVQVGAGTGYLPVKRVIYAYCDGSSGSFGSVNDLQTASQQLPGSGSTWNTVAVDYYRYWVAGDTTGFVHGLKMHFGPEAYR